MRHICIRVMIGLIWLVAAIVCGVSGNFPMAGLYLVLAGVFLYSAYAAGTKRRDHGSVGFWGSFLCLAERGAVCDAGVVLSHPGLED